MKQTGIQVALRMSIPVFVEGVPRGSSKLSWSGAAIRRDQTNGDRRLAVRIANVGTAHVLVRVLEALATEDPRSPPLAQSPGAYLLAGQGREFSIKIPPGAAPRFIRALTDEQAALYGLPPH